MHRHRWGVGANAEEPEGTGQVIGLGWSALGLSLLGSFFQHFPVLAALIMAAAGASLIVFSISMFAVIAPPLFLVRTLLAEFGMRPKVSPRLKEEKWRIPNGQ